MLNKRIQPTAKRGGYGLSFVKEELTDFTTNYNTRDYF